MYKQIGQLLKDTKGKPLDKEFISDAFDIMVSHDKLDEYATGLNFNDEECDGSYDNHDGIININIDRISSWETSEYCKRLNSLLILRHEIEHAKNMRTMIMTEGIESTVIRYSVMCLAPATDKKIGFPKPILSSYLSTYDVDPDERIADIRAYKFMINLLKNKRNSVELLTTRERLYQAYIRGYSVKGDIITPPTYSYLLKSGLFDHYIYFSDFISNRTQYSLDTRVLCGLPITKEEKEVELLLKSGLKKH